MKKTTLFICMFLLIGIVTNAQQFGIKAGANLSSMFAKDNEETYSDEFEMTPGFHIGPTAEFSLTEMLSFETGLLLSTKGTKYSEKEDGDEYTQKYNLLYLDIPLTAKAKFDIGNSKIYGAFGPYVGIGISGKEIYKETYDGETDKETYDIKWGTDEDNDDLKRLDYGLTIGAGVEMSNFTIGLEYALGLANIATYTGDGNKINNRVLGITVGYKFGEN